MCFENKISDRHYRHCYYKRLRNPQRIAAKESKQRFEDGRRRAGLKLAEKVRARILKNHTECEKCREGEKPRQSYICEAFTQTNAPLTKMALGQNRDERHDRKRAGIRGESQRYCTEEPKFAGFEIDQVGNRNQERE